MSEYIEYNEWLEFKVKNLERENEEFKESHIKHITNMENYYKDRVQELKKQNEKLYKPHEVFKFKEQIERLKIDKYKYIELYKQKYDENFKLTDELSLKTRQNSILSLEINELKQELKEYRGF